MRKSFAAFAFAVFALVPPATATTFPSLTTIYVGTGVFDSGHGDNAGTATVFFCSNVSGIAAQVRFVVLDNSANVVGNVTVNVAHGESTIAATHGVTVYEGEASMLVGIFGRQTRGAVLNIESTQSGVFCTARIQGATLGAEEAVPLHLVRVNPHPGTVE
jgi:hypothetical protein